MNATAPWKLDTPDASDVLPESPDLSRRRDSGAEQRPLATLADTGQLADLTPLFDAESIDGGKIRDGLNPVAIEAGDYGGKEVVYAIDSLEPNAWKQPSVKMAAEALLEIRSKGYMLQSTEGLDHIQSQTRWNEGKAAFIPSGSWLENEQKKVAPKDFATTVAPTPLMDGSKLPFQSTRGQRGRGVHRARQGQEHPGRPGVPPDHAVEGGGVEVHLRLVLADAAQDRDGLRWAGGRPRHRRRVLHRLPEGGRRDGQGPADQEAHAQLAGAAAGAGRSAMRHGQYRFIVGFLLPQVLSVPVIAVIWAVILDPTPNGLVNSAMRRVGFGGSGLAGRPQPGAVLRALGPGVGQRRVLPGAVQRRRVLGPQGHLRGGGDRRGRAGGHLPPGHDPAAVGTIQTTWVYLAILALDVYALVAVMTPGPGGLANATQAISLQIAQNGFQFSRAGYASAMGVVLFFFTLIIAAIRLRATRRQRIEY
jgi:hypothetical protein